jgi:hypothetical protein
MSLIQTVIISPFEAELMAFRLDVLGTIAETIRRKRKDGAKTTEGTKSPASAEEKAEVVPSAPAEGMPAAGAVPPSDAQDTEPAPKKKPAPGQRRNLITREEYEELGLPEITPQNKVKKKALYTGERSLVRFKERESPLEHPYRKTAPTRAARRQQQDLPLRESSLAYEPVLEDEAAFWEDDGLSPRKAQAPREPNQVPRERSDRVSPSEEEREQAPVEKPSAKRSIIHREHAIGESDVGEDRFSEMRTKGRKTTRFVETAHFGSDLFSDRVVREKINDIPGGMGLSSERRVAKRAGVKTERFREESGLGATVAPDDISESGMRKRTGVRSEWFQEESGLGATVAPDDAAEDEIRKRTGVKTERFTEKEGLGIKTKPEGPESAEGRVRTGVDTEQFTETAGMGAERIEDDLGKDRIAKFIGEDDLKSSKKHRLVRK